MTESAPPPPADQPLAQPAASAPPPHAAPAPYGTAPGAPMPAYAGAVPGQPGKIRSTGTSILLYFVTFGIYGIIYYYSTHEEMKRHSGQGIGGAIALILALFAGIVSPFLLSSEVGSLRARAGQEKKVGAGTGAWYFPGIFILVGPFIWFAKTNGALNDYWRSQGAQG